jgi:hypothetical protein
LKALSFANGRDIVSTKATVESHGGKGFSRALSHSLSHSWKERRSRNADAWRNRKVSFSQDWPAFSQIDPPGGTFRRLPDHSPAIYLFFATLKNPGRHE